MTLEQLAFLVAGMRSNGGVRNSFMDELDPDIRDALTVRQLNIVFLKYSVGMDGQEIANHLKLGGRWVVSKELRKVKRRLLVAAKGRGFDVQLPVAL